MLTKADLVTYLFSSTRGLLISRLTRYSSMLELNNLASKLEQSINGALSAEFRSIHELAF